MDQAQAVGVSPEYLKMLSITSLPTEAISYVSEEKSCSPGKFTLLKTS